VSGVFLPGAGFLTRRLVQVVFPFHWCPNCSDLSGSWQIVSPSLFVANIARPLDTASPSRRSSSPAHIRTWSYRPEMEKPLAAPYCPDRPQRAPHVMTYGISADDILSWTAARAGLTWIFGSVSVPGRIGVADPVASSQFQRISVAFSGGLVLVDNGSVRSASCSKILRHKR